MDLFELPNNNNFLNYEKSANYFDEEGVPKRVKALIKNVKLVAFIMNPIRRAYSWYQVKLNKTRKLKIKIKNYFEA